MALKSCKECGREVSTEAEACPGCGVPEPTRRPPEEPSRDEASAEPIPETGACLGCGKEISVLPGERCPECGVADPLVPWADLKTTGAGGGGHGWGGKVLGAVAVVYVAGMFFAGSESSGTSGSTSASARTSSEGCSSAGSFVSGLKSLYDGQGVTLLTGKYDCEGDLLWLWVDNTWYTLPCHIREQTYVAIRKAWNVSGGTQVIIKDPINKTVGDFKLLSSAPVLEGC